MEKVKFIEDKETWEGFLLSGSRQPFFQSWNWGEVQERLGNTIYRLGLYKGMQLLGICLVVEIRAKRGSHFHLRHGPLLTNFPSQLDPLLTFIKEKAKERGVDFIRMSPLLEANTFDISLLRSRGFRNSPIHNMDAENAWALDLDTSEEELLSGMRKTTRYLVRKAQTLPIEISTRTNPSDFKSFMNLYETTSKRHKFIPHRGVAEEFAIFTKTDEAKLFIARYKKKVLAGALVIFYGNQAVYHHGASSDEYRKIPAAYAVQWEAIKEAKKQGKKLYNFWGVVPPEKPKHPWQGLTLFKMGFGGRRVNFIHAQDLPLNVNYWKTYAIETAWRIRRGY